MNMNTLGIRKQGIYLCFTSYKQRFGRYPETSEELTAVTSTRLSDHRFKKYSDWFYGFTGEARDVN